jgi:predicted adenine nucleotide alpha hydrolase (AANH) superfamily ATPase
MIAAKGKFDAFTTTLMYSKWQDHDAMKEMCEYFSKKYKVPFHYEDYREGWKEGIEISKECEMYRQQYCGCIYSEEDRYRKQLSKRLAEGQDIKDSF